MTRAEIDRIIRDEVFPDAPGEIELYETHASWVILTAHFAFKIKKPLHYSFLDFSSLEKRKLYCRRELRLNRRFAEEVYLAVLPVREKNGRLKIGGKSGVIVDYALKMKKLDNRLRMDFLLKNGDVDLKRLERLAAQLADFHKNAPAIRRRIAQKKFQNDFADLRVVLPFIKEKFGEKSAAQLEATIDFSDEFLKKMWPRISARKRAGFFIDGHGDLHSRNIFLYKTPVIFDCIEFNDDFRRLDVLNELAFFCMDLEHFGRTDLAEKFMQFYEKDYPVILQEADRLLFQYFKMYRANVRLKVYALKAAQGEKDLSDIKAYFDQMLGYCTELEKAFSVKK